MIEVIRQVLLPVIDAMEAGTYFDEKRDSEEQQWVR